MKELIYTLLFMIGSVAFMGTCIYKNTIGDTSEADERKEHAQCMSRALYREGEKVKVKHTDKYLPILKINCSGDTRRYGLVNDLAEVKYFYEEDLEK